MNSPARLLLVADVEADQTLIRQALLHRYPQLEIHIATDLDATIALFSAGSFDAVIVDCAMSGRGGSTVLQYIRETDREVAIALLTATGDDKLAATARKWDVDNYIDKHAKSADTIAASLQFALDHAAARTSYQAAQRTLAERERRFAFALDSFGAGVFDYYPASKRIYCSESMRDMLCVADAQPASLDDVFRHVHPADVEHVWHAIERAAGGLTGQDTIEFRVQAPGRELRWVQFPHHVFVDDTEATRLIGLVVDITASHHTEAAHATSRDDLRRRSYAIDNMRENERRRISREIHDDIGQVMTAAQIKLGILTAERQDGRLDEVAELLDDALERLRTLATSLRPVSLDDLGLTSALGAAARALTKGSEIVCMVDLDDAAEATFDTTVTSAVYRIVHEALTNAVHHARALRVTLHARMRGEDAVEITVTDDGIGFDVERRKGLGLIGMYERANAINATLGIESDAHSGTRVTLGVPVAP